MVIEILSFSCSVLLLVKADGDHLAVPNCKIKIKKIILIQSWYNSVERYFQFYTLLFFSKGCHLDRSILSNFKTTHCKNHFDINLVIIHKAVIEILSIYVLCYFQ